jgi:hypothetical protein
VIACDGSFTFGLSLRSAASFHDLISPRKILARVRTVQGDVAGLDAFDIHHGRDAAEDGRELHQTVQFQFRTIERHVGGAEGHLLGLDLSDAVARSDRPIGDLDASLPFVCAGPFRVDRKREGRASARNVGRGDGLDRARGKAPACRKDLQEGSRHRRSWRWREQDGGQQRRTRPAPCWPNFSPPRGKMLWLYDHFITVQ